MFNLTKKQLKASAKLLHQASIEGGGSAWLILKKILTAVALAEILQEKEHKWVWISYDNVLDRTFSIYKKDVESLLRVNHVGDGVSFFGVDGRIIREGTLQDVITESEKYWSSFFG